MFIGDLTHICRESTADSAILCAGSKIMGVLIG